MTKPELQEESRRVQMKYGKSKEQIAKALAEFSIHK